MLSTLTTFKILDQCIFLVALILEMRKPKTKTVRIKQRTFALKYCAKIFVYQNKFGHNI